MLTFRCLFRAVLTFALLSALAHAQTIRSKTTSSQEGESCTRYSPASDVQEPRDLPSNNGLLKVALRVRSSRDQNGRALYCYLDEHGNQAPTLRVRPGDTLVVNLKNEIAPSSRAGAPVRHNHHSNACAGSEMNSTSTNLHFHGLAVPAVCHQDETLKTVVEAGSSPFQYRIHIPEKQPPGLYWYHPHIHGFSEEQVLGGASGALIVEGVERVDPRIAGLPERVLVVRDEKMREDSVSGSPDPNRPTKDLSINYTPVPYPQYPPAVIKMRPSEKEFWRVLNASADTYLDLSVEFGSKRQGVSMVSLDGVPVGYGLGISQIDVPQQFHIFLPPAARAEFIVTGPPPGTSGLLVSNYVNRGADDENGRRPTASKAQPATRVGLDDVDPRRPLATLVASADAPSPNVMPQPETSLSAIKDPPLTSVRPIRKRVLFFSEELASPSDPKSATLFFITEEGHIPAVFDPQAEPTIRVRQGDVEDWTIENRSRESHVFHVHQLHFVMVGAQGVPWEQPALRDTINLPAWDGFRKYPSVTVRMDFRDPEIVGVFPFHCHILQHIDGGMMGTIEVRPAGAPSGKK